MGRTIVEFIPIMIGAAVAPVWIMLVLLLLRNRGGLSKAIAFVSGQILVRLAQGIVFRGMSGSSTGTQMEERMAIVVDTLFLVGGVLLWITALKKWCKEEDPDEPPPKWMAMLNSISTPKAFGLSILLMTVAAKQWIFTFSALGLIREAELPGLDSAIAFLVFILGAQSLVLIPIGVYVVAPKHAPRLLEATIQWLERNNRTIAIVVSMVFGTYFIFKGIAGLRG
ncbi:MAG TPA: GAP family protein [Verrucomicrobiae bacterium]|nr:GAP family protein [Verrucomicrobiae bacterium]